MIQLPKNATRESIRFHGWIVAESPDLLPIAPPAPSSGETPWLRLLLLTARCHRSLSQSITGPDEATAPELLLLSCAAERGEFCQQSDLVEMLGCSPAHVSGVVERLRQRGWLTADRQASDRRRQCCHVTPTGLTVLAGLKISPSVADELATDLAALAALLGRLDLSHSSPAPAARNSA